MPSSDNNIIPSVMNLVNVLRPDSILDVGVGNGKYGFLFREALDWNYGRFLRDEYTVSIDGVEAFRPYIRPYHGEIYDDIEIADIREYVFKKRYDLVFFGDVLEHLSVLDWEAVLARARDNAGFIIVTTPNRKAVQGTVFGNPYEEHLSSVRLNHDWRTMSANSKYIVYLWEKTPQIGEEALKGFV